jgi:hypothetical protein
MFEDHYREFKQTHLNWISTGKCEMVKREDFPFLARFKNRTFLNELCAEENIPITEKILFVIADSSDFQ